MMLVQLVALGPFSHGQKNFTRPPSNARARSAAYTFHVDEIVAKALVHARKCAPAFYQDEAVLRRIGVRCRAFWPRLANEGAPEPTPEPTEAPIAAPEPEADTSTLASVIDAVEAVTKALDDGRASALKAGLRAAGLDSSDYPNNAKRISALEGWLGAHS